jgi:GPH family glycoside/pentoside/hexuronide:cation symporter
MSRKIGKKNAFMVSQGIALIGYASLWFLFVPGKPWMFIFSLPFHSFGIGSLFVLMMSMTADVIDLDELNYGVRREGVFGAIYWYMVKFGFAIAGGLSGVILTVVGFDGNAAVQPEGAVDGLRLFFSGFPMLGTIAAMYLMHDYDVDEARANEIREELKKRKEAKTKPAIPYSDYQSGKAISLSDADQQMVATLQSQFQGKSSIEIKAMFSQVLNSGFHGLCFSPYQEGQNIGDSLSEKQIRRRMEIIAPHTQWVRSFSCTDGNELIPRIAREKGLKTMVGAWLGTDKSKNEAEIAQLIQLAKEGLVDIAVVGNEVLLRNELTEEEVLGFLKRVKQALPNLPVSYVDTYYQLSQRPEILASCDLVLANCYPFWEGCDIDQAPVYLKKMYEVAKSAGKGKEVIITETGWPDSGDKMHAAEPTPENAMKYLIAANEWAKKENISLFTFSSFDEPWKVHHEGEVGQSWGIWDKNEHLKY